MNERQAGRPHIVVLDDWEGALQRLVDWSPIRALAEVRIHRETLHGEPLHEALQAAQVVVLNRNRTPMDAALLARLPRLEYLVFTGPRNWQIAYPELRARGIPVSGTEGGPALESTCEHTWALILAWARGLEAQFAVMRSGGWRSDPPAPLARVLSGETLGLIGLGRVGTRVAAVAKALGMNVLCWSPNMTAERAAACSASAVPLEDLLRRSLVVSLHLVPAAGSGPLLDRARLTLMRHDALLVNTSRAELLDMQALAEALRDERIAAAALDVWPEEPLAGNDPLRGVACLVPTPHTGFCSEAVFADFARGVGECLMAWLAGRPLPRQVDGAASAH